MLFKYISRNAFRGYRQLVRGLTYENRLHVFVAIGAVYADVFSGEIAGFQHAFYACGISDDYYRFTVGSTERADGHGVFAQSFLHSNLTEPGTTNFE